jgi:Galactose oxidase, central domain
MDSEDSVKAALPGAIAFLAASCGAFGQQTWNQVVKVPVDRGFYASAFDPLRGQLVLFGGTTAAGGVALGDTWVWDGASWTLKTPVNSPSARWGAAMAYDSVHAQIVLFGGISGPAGSNNSTSVALSDTWVWDGVNWIQQSPATSPPARYLHTLGYDSHDGRAVLFGGTASSNSTIFHGNTVAMNDTWLWDGSNWSQSSPAASPTARSQSAVAYDSVRQRLILFGGANGGSASSTLADTWAWDGSNWTHLFPSASPPARSGHALTFDPVAQQVVLFGGDPSSAANHVLLGGAPSGGEDSDTWTWNGANWSQQSPAVKPVGRAAMVANYDTARQEAVFFGGIGNGLNPFNSDTWIWNGTNWASPPQTVHPTARFGAAVVYDPLHQEVLVAGGYPGADTWTWDGAAWTQQSPVTSLLGSRQYQGVWDAARQQVFAFSNEGESFVWDGTNWTEKNVANAPYLYGDALGYDALHQRVVAFGIGESGNSETWLWDGATWTQVSPVNSPSTRTGPAMVYDTGHQDIVLFGGYDQNSSTAQSDTWLWDGTNWTEVSPANIHRRDRMPRWTTIPPLPESCCLAAASPALRRRAS